MSLQRYQQRLSSATKSLSSPLKVYSTTPNNALNPFSKRSQAVSSVTYHPTLHGGSHAPKFTTDPDARPTKKPASRPRRIVVGITGATGTVFAIRLLTILRELGVETHLVMSKWAMATAKYETPLTEQEILSLATRAYVSKDMSAPIASGSFIHDGMMIVPCSMKTLSAVRTGYCDDLISRAADVSLKEGRRLLLAVRETPLSDVHLDNMLFLRRAGAVIFPPIPAFYIGPQTLEDIIDHSVGRMLDSFGIHTDGFERWNGFDWSKKRSQSA